MEITITVNEAGNVDVKVSKEIHQVVAIGLLEMAKAMVLEGKSKIPTEAVSEQM